MPSASTTATKRQARVGRSPFTGHVILVPAGKRASVTIAQARRAANAVRAAEAQQ